MKRDQAAQTLTFGALYCTQVAASSFPLSTFHTFQSSPSSFLLAIHGLLALSAGIAISPIADLMPNQQYAQLF